MILPFKKTSVYAGLGSTSGIIKFENRTLQIEYQTIDELFKYFKSEARQVTFQLSDIESVEMKSGWFSYKLFIDVRSLKALDKFPAVKGNRIKLKVSRTHREKLKSLKSSLSLAISEHKLDQLDSHSDEYEYENESLKNTARTDGNQGQRSGRSDQKTRGGLQNALEKRDQLK
ncbi:hypothetical protein DYD21_12340 [Rhodohalobacter sp. SW132]|uniref:hypothetical protein n=1 Tax=Rhodohalobacter sp. SW132 TaxID=2293433 RepID=UPI000E266506|nr:hypothetical protein [Rhodohalobacter sp. SW132]REL33043.1 hypothetical protein DYD21_12340 [Rhodohalobacter sp. SW132]